jgi:hypothetical protein
MKKISSILIICLILLATMPAPVAASIVTPETITDTLKAGDTEHDTITVTLPSTAPKGDVVFVFDASGSMGSQLTAMKAKAGVIMTNVRTGVPDTNFGVGSFVDYPHYYDNAANDGYTATYGSGSDYAWRLDQDLTSDPAAVQTGFNNINILNGADWPQNYARALYESKESFSWRSDAKKIVVIFGDAEPHAYPNGLSIGLSATKGGDPGRDEIMSNADDLDYVTVVQSLAASNIIVVAVDCAGYGDARTSFQYMADQTGGSRFDYSSDSIAADIVAKINAATTADIKELTIKVRDPAYASWVTSTPTSYYGVPWGETRTFAVDITPPADTFTGTYTIYLDVYGDGVLLGTTTVTKSIDGITPAPEFPTLALPVAMILGLLFMVYSVRSRKD